MNKEVLARLEEIRREFESRLANVKAQLAEAEKPKLRHGDFGYCDEPRYPRIVLDKDKLASEVHVFDRHKNDEPTVILGNVFDLMKGWDKPFERWEIKKTNTDEFYFHIESTGRQEIAFKLNNTGNWFYASISEAEDFHNALGHAIAELKRKQGD